MSVLIKNHQICGDVSSDGQTCHATVEAQGKDSCAVRPIRKYSPTTLHLRLLSAQRLRVFVSVSLHPALPLRMQQQHTPPQAILALITTPD